MKIAFISYEYPPDTAYGGIATYVEQAAQMLQRRGHYIEVFTGSPARSGTVRQDGLLVHRVQVADQASFTLPIGQVFSARHTLVQFDVLEGPEFYADAREAVRLVPDIPLVVKLHTPSILLLQLNYYEHSLVKKVALYILALLAGRTPAWGYDPRIAAHRRKTLRMNQIERSHALEADEIATPSRSLGSKLIEVWGLDTALVSHVPYPYIPAERLLQIPVETQTNVVTFVGRLEVRKGVLELARAIPHILGRLPKTRFRFVGPSDASPHPGLDMQQYLERMLRRYRQSIEFTGPVTPGTIPDILAKTDVCIFPSLWENFPCVCLEAMAAARGIVGSSAGGMSDMLDSGRAGQIVPPGSPKGLARATLAFLTNPALRRKLGQAARERLLTEYNANRVSALQEASYSRAIAHRRTLGPRPQYTYASL
jgi:glycosyltransferase involved in cell wall biosynthesis